MADEVVRRRRAADAGVVRNVAIRRAKAELGARLRSAFVVLGDERQELTIDREWRRATVARNDVRAHRRDHVATIASHDQTRQFQRKKKRRRQQQPCACIRRTRSTAGR
jgi:hypothetical protein